MEVGVSKNKVRIVAKLFYFLEIHFERGVFKTLLNVYDGAFTEIDNDQKLLSSQKTPY